MASDAGSDNIFGDLELDATIEEYVRAQQPMELLANTEFTSAAAAIVSQNPVATPSGRNHPDIPLDILLGKIRKLVPELRLMILGLLPHNLLDLIGPHYSLLYHRKVQKGSIIGNKSFLAITQQLAEDVKYIQLKTLHTTFIPRTLSDLKAFKFSAMSKPVKSAVQILDLTFLGYHFDEVSMNARSF